MKSAVNSIKVWDPVVRIGHWLLVMAFFAAYFTESGFMTLHTWAGYLIAVVVGIRMVWGFVGTRYARFSDFVRSPSETLRYIGDLRRDRAKRHLGHNPAGAVMIIALLLSLLATVVSGMGVYGFNEGAGPLAAWLAVSDEQGVLWLEFHEVVTHLTMLLVALHVSGVVLVGQKHRENLFSAMLTGRKKIDLE